MTAAPIETGTGAVVHGSPYRLEFIQGMRGIWVTVIVIAHADERVFPGAYAALDMFFVASGLVITLLLLRDYQRKGHVEVLMFYLRRGRRLLPSLGLMLWVTAVGTLLFLSPLGSQGTAARTGIFTSVQASNLDLYRAAQGYFEVGSRNVPLLHTWSLGVEEQVYLLLPASLILAVLLAKRVRWGSLRVFVGVIGTVSVASFVLFALWTSGHGELPGIHNLDRAAFYLPVARAWEIGIGMLIACWYLEGKPLPGRLAGFLVTVGLTVMTIFTLFPLVDDEQRTSAWLLLPIGGLVLVLLGCREYAGLPAQVLSFRPAVWIGDLSYSWYLWHLPVIVFARAWFDDTARVSLIAAALSFPLGWASYHYVERPLRYAPRGQLRPTFIRRSTAIVLISAVVPATAFYLVHASVARTLDLAPVAHMADQIEPRRVADLRGCSNPEARTWDEELCTLGGSRRGRPVYLVGDSTAGMYTPVLRSFARRHGSPLVLLNVSSCPFVDVPIQTPGHDADLCLAQVQDRLNWLEGQRHGVVFTAVSDRLLQGNQGLIGEDSQRVLASERQVEEALRRTFRRVVAAGHSVVVAEPTPHPGAGRTSTEDWFARECPLLRMLYDVASCGPSVSEAATRERSRPVVEALTRIAESFPLVSFSPVDPLCPDGTCRSIDGGRWIFYDSNHLTHHGVRRVQPQVEAALRRAISSLRSMRGFR